MSLQQRKYLLFKENTQRRAQIKKNTITISSNAQQKFKDSKNLKFLLIFFPPQLWCRICLLYGGVWSLLRVYVQLGLHHDNQTKPGIKRQKENKSTGIFQLAIICMSFAAYAVEAFAYECEPDPFIVQVIDHGWQISWHIFLSQLTAAATVAVVTFVNCWSVELATKVQDIFCSFKLGAVAIIIAGGAYRWGFGNAISVI